MPLEYDRGVEQVWVSGALCVRTGQALTHTAPARTTRGSLALVQTLDQAYPQGDLDRLAENLSSPLRGPIQDWLAAHPRFQHACIPVGAAWLTRIEGWWRPCRRKAFAGESLAHAKDFASVTHLATAHLNRHATPWIWGRLPAAAPHAAALLCLSPLRNDALSRFCQSGHAGW